MRHLAGLLVLASIHLHGVTAAPQVPLALPKRPIHGRFLQITDIHPDPWYKPKSAPSHACHRKKSKKKNVAGYWGHPFEECDTPLRLSNLTLDFLDKKWSSEIDFVVWTGDNARHDNDRKIPRTPAEIYDLNRHVADKMFSAFTSKGIPVIPSLGNNDVWHAHFCAALSPTLVQNIMMPGPNSITNEFASIWKSFIPFPHLQIFQRGAYYAVEVIPDAVAVISLNTMYFYDSNKAVGGCLFKERDDAGNLQFDWLEVQLKGFRARGMQVWISGATFRRLPDPTFRECYVRYVELSLRFQDTILGHLYGHMNVDHFFFLEADDLNIVVEDAPKANQQPDLYKVLMQDFSAMPNAKEIDLDNYAIVSVAPSVVPNPYRRRVLLKLWTPLGFTQYFMADLGASNKTEPPNFELEYSTFDSEVLEHGIDGWYPVPKKNLPKKLKKRQTAYGMGALTVKEWVGLARRVVEEEKVQSIFRSHMYVGG
ncbi:RFX-type winged-helix domain-containing protein [Mycena chlorophos]|uniref:RFX-type winged-helix domain-containing protein n=1 Tax=Mycena chlorophos TaxID=658473 RepID=A0A8H6S593_MYCCL|nr:RFX-type winged-helix domain-containing protein [Mycena chlorophos]